MIIAFLTLSQQIGFHLSVLRGRQENRSLPVARQARRRGQKDREPRAAARLALHGDAASMRLNDLSRRGKSQA
jgi:hypothetical protein